MATLILLRLLVDGVAGGGTLGASAAVLAGALGLVALLGAWTQSLSGLVTEAHAQRVADHVAEKLHAKSLELDLEYYDDPHYYDVLHRAQQEAPYRPLRVVSDLTAIGQGGLALLAMTGLLASIRWELALVLFASALPGILVKVRSARELFAWQRSRTEHERRAWYYQQMLIDGAYAKEARAFGFGDVVRGWFRNTREGLRRERLELLRKRTWGQMAAQAVGVAPLYGALVYLVLETAAGRQTLGDLVLFYTAAQRGLSSLQELLAGLAGFYENNLFLSNFSEFLELPSRIVEPERPRPMPASIGSGWALQEASFRYPRAEQEALSGVSLRIGPGEVVALVGENGAGKSTLVKLLCRLYDPGSGSVTLNGTPLRELPLAGLRRRITVGFQDHARYHLTLRENVWLGDVTAPLDPERLERAVELAGAARVARGLPQSVDTLLGHWLEGGHELSVGEWQRVALARVLWRDAWLVILDEPTSAMDPEAENRFWEELRPALEGRAALLISHRFSTVRQADRIYVLERGRVAESGSHDELVGRASVYARLYASQARYYG
ncbi:MAG TPA: ABC transporter ATP-binding protein [Vicinamibacteria bacterium]|nr:ABC transporter ATP-binding protein [Vicinamibacteria bacterium]